MVSFATIRAKVNYGLSKGAAAIGTTANWYRPVGALISPLDPSALMGALLVAYDTAPALPFVAPSKFNAPLFYLMADATNLIVGDYLSGTQDGTFFIASIESVKVPLAVRCNRTLTFSKDAPVTSGPSGYGPQPYSGQGGAARSTMVPYLTAWPASLLAGTKGEANPTGLPDDVRAPWVQVIIPAYPGVTINTSDQFSDDLGRTFTISSVEYSPLGVRLTAMYSDA